MLTFNKLFLSVGPMSFCLCSLKTFGELLIEFTKETPFDLSYLSRLKTEIKVVAEKRCFHPLLINECWNFLHHDHYLKKKHNFKKKKIIKWLKKEDYYL